MSTANDYIENYIRELVDNVPKKHFNVLELGSSQMLLFNQKFTTSSSANGSIVHLESGEYFYVSNGKVLTGLGLRQISMGSGMVQVYKAESEINADVSTHSIEEKILLDTIELVAAVKPLHL